MIGGSGRQFVFALTGDASGIRDAADQASSALGRTADTTEALDHANKSAGRSGENLASRLSAVGVAGFALTQVAGWGMGLARALVEAQTASDRLYSQLGAATGAARAGQELAYVRGVANELGLEVDSTAQAYARFASASRGTSLEGQAMRDVFEAVAKQSAVMGASADETTGILRALEQMVSKGVVQAEEFKNQLGDRLPGALQIGARAMGVTTGQLMKMMEAGELISTEFLPRFARQLELEMGDAAERASDRMGAATQRVSNAWDLLVQDVAASGMGDFIKGQLNILADGFTNVSEKIQQARAEGGGYHAQMRAATYATAEFLNPFNALAYTASSTAGELEQARRKLAELKAEMAAGSGSIFLAGDIKQLEDFIAKAEQAKRSAINLRQVDNETMARYERGEDEETRRRRDRLKAVTAELAGETGKLAKAQKTLAESFLAGDLQRPEYERLLAQAQDQFGTKAAKPKRSGNAVADAEEQFMQRIERWSERNQNALDAADQREADNFSRATDDYLKERERRTERAAQMEGQLAFTVAQLGAQQITDERARGQALIAIERAQLTSRLDLLQVDAATRQRVQEQIDQYVLAREAQLTDALKPEWQRRLEQWGDLIADMERRHDDFVTGFVDRGRDAFEEFLATGRVSTRTLVDYMRSEFARLAYERFLANSVSSLAGTLFDAFLGLGSGTPVAPEFTTGLPLPPFDRPGEGFAKGINYVPRDMMALIHEGEAVVPKKYNPAAGAPAGMGKVIFNNHYYAAPGTSRADLVAMGEAAKAAAVAQVADMLARGNRAMAPAGA